VQLGTWQPRSASTLSFSHQIHLAIDEIGLLEKCMGADIDVLPFRECGIFGVVDGIGGLQVATFVRDHMAAKLKEALETQCSGRLLAFAAQAEAAGYSSTKAALFNAFLALDADLKYPAFGVPRVVALKEGATAAFVRFSSPCRPDASLPGAAEMQSLVEGGAPPPDYDVVDVPLDMELADYANFSGFRPLIFAATLAKFELFLWLWEQKKDTAWVYAHARADNYALRGIDDIADLIESDGSKRTISALELMTYDDSAGAVLHGGALKELLQRKWRNFARNIFWRRFALVVAFLASLTIIIRGRSRHSTGASGSASDLLSQPRFAVLPSCAESGFDRFISHPATVLDLFGALQVTPAARTCAWSVMLEAFAVACFFAKALHTAFDLAGGGLSNFLKGRGNTALERSFSVAFIVTGAAWAALPSLVGSDIAASAMRPLLTFFSVSAWCYCFWFAMAFIGSGQFVKSMASMVQTDVFSFSLVLLIVLGAFSSAFFMLSPLNVGRSFVYTTTHAFVSMVSGELFDLKDSPAAPPVAHYGPLKVENAPSSDVAAHPTLLYATQPLFLFAGSIMLLNLLIAMMGDTFGDMKEKMVNQALLERARIIRHIERSMSDSERLHARNTYWTVIHGQAMMLVETNNENLLTSPEGDNMTRLETESVKNAAARAASVALPGASEAARSQIVTEAANGGTAQGERRARRRSSNAVPALSVVRRSSESVRRKVRAI